ncbi:MAG: hypothetical protein L6Q60_14195 [Rhodocyclaceae bacterium]|nr:hypothetical protein [Rhodocyclaceae bacterium]
MKPRDFPPEIAKALSQFSPVSRAWAAASGFELEDVRQEIAVAILVGEDPVRAVPRTLRIRRVGGVWRSLDVLPAAGELGNHDVVFGDEEAPLCDDDSGIAAAIAGGSDHVAARCGVGRRAAQLRLRAQLARFEAAGDLFAVVGGE